jgi:hypothetical protein
MRRRYQQRAANGAKANLEYPLKGILWCETHQWPYTVGYSTWKGRFYRSCRCPRGYRYANLYGSCAQPHVNAREVEERLTLWMLKSLGEYRRFRSVLEKKRHRLEESGNIEAIERAKARLTELDQERSRVMISFERGWCTQEEAELRLKAIREERELRQEELDRAEAECGNILEVIEQMDSLISLCEAHIESDEEFRRKYPDCESTGGFSPEAFKPVCGPFYTPEFIAWRQEAIKRDLSEVEPFVGTQVNPEFSANLMKIALKRVIVTDQSYPDDLEVLLDLNDLVPMGQTIR